VRWRGQLINRWPSPKASISATDFSARLNAPPDNAMNDAVICASPRLPLAEALRACTFSGLPVYF
jgi:hypothetical protein